LDKINLVPKILERVDVVQQAMGKMAKAGAANWSAKNRVIWINQTPEGRSRRRA
jgi:hypothetical protein